MSAGISQHNQVAKGLSYLQTQARVRVLVVGAVYVCAGLRLFFLTNRYAVNILFRDQWKFDEATLFEQHSLFEIFRWQHGPHRQGLGGVVSKIIEPSIRWNSRYEAFGIVAILLLTALLALCLKKKLFGKIEFADSAIPLIFLTPVQYQVIFEGANPSHGPVSVLLLIAYCLTLTIESQKLRLTAVLSVNLLLIYTGFGLFIGLITPLLMLNEYRCTRDRQFILAFVIAAISFGSFFIGYKLIPATECFSLAPGNPFLYVLFAGFMLSSFVGVQPVPHMIPAIFLGMTLLCALLWVFGRAISTWWAKSTPQRGIVLVLIGYYLLFALATAYGRLCLGLSAAQASRYTCYTAVAFFALYLATRFTRSSAHVAAIMVLALMSTFGLSRLDKRQIAVVSLGRKQWHDCYLKNHTIAECDAIANSTIYWTPEPIDLQQKLEFLESHHLNLFSENDEK